MGLSELVSRISSSDAECAIVISTWRGNPGEITFLLPTGREALVLRVESAKLRREMGDDERIRIGRLGCVVLRTGCERIAAEVGRLVASLLRAEVVDSAEPPSEGDQGAVALWFDSPTPGKILWTHYHMHEGKEIGPRIRIKSFRGIDESEV